MEQGKRKFTLKDLPIKFDPNDNTFISSKLADDNGNVSLFKLIIDPNEPFIRQRINDNERIIY
jgi:hypothetical protein